jgi:hypothetical protein
MLEIGTTKLRANRSGKIFPNGKTQVCFRGLQPGQRPMDEVHGSAMTQVSGCIEHTWKYASHFKRHARGLSPSNNGKLTRGGGGKQWEPKPQTNSDGSQPR